MRLPAQIQSCEVLLSYCFLLCFVLSLLLLGLTQTRLLAFPYFLIPHLFILFIYTHAAIQYIPYYNTSYLCMLSVAQMDHIMNIDIKQYGISVGQYIQSLGLKSRQNPYIIYNSSLKIAKQNGMDGNPCSNMQQSRDETISKAEDNKNVGVKNGNNDMIIQLSQKLNGDIAQILQLIFKQSLRTHNQLQIRDLAIDSYNALCMIFTWITQWHILERILIKSEEIQIDNKLLKPFSMIKFQHLKYLNLWHNNIQSIQLLSDLQVPVLSELVLSENRIVSIKPLRKMNAPYLKKLYFMNNCILQWDSLTQLICFTPPSFDHLDAQTQNGRAEQKIEYAGLNKLTIRWKDQKKKYYNISFMAKLKLSGSFGLYGLLETNQKLLTNCFSKQNIQILT